MFLVALVVIKTTADLPSHIPVQQFRPPEQPSEENCSLLCFVCAGSNTIPIHEEARAAANKSNKRHPGDLIPALICRHHTAEHASHLCP